MPAAALIPAAQLLRAVRPLVFDTAAEARARLTATFGREPSCTSGCVNCCHVKVLAQVAEGARAYLHLKAAGRWSPALEERLRAADATLTARTHRAVLEERIPCVFLDPRGRCRIYPVRPTACAVTFALDDPARCADVDGRSLCQVLIRGPRSMLLQLDALDSVVEEALWQDAEPRFWAMTLPGAVLTAAAQLEGEPLPDVRRVAIRDLLDGGRELPEVFDEVAQ
jgi:Fe-S-cluster containining protein